jgi:hypothetical protein
MTAIQKNASRVNRDRIETAFSIFCTITLGVTALAKFVSVHMHPEFAKKQDIVFSFLSINDVLNITAALEVIVAWLCIKKVAPRYKWLAVFWLGTCFVLYRVGPWIILGKAKIECKCLGEFAFVTGSGIVEAGLFHGLLREFPAVVSLWLLARSS